MRIVVLAVALLGLAGCAATPAPPEPFTLVGNLELTTANLNVGGGSCAGPDGYSDITPGASVTVYDAAGTIVGTGSLPAGTKLNSTTCRFRFEVPNVPSTSEFYSVEVSNRGKVTVDRGKAQSTGVQMELGT